MWLKAAATMFCAVSSIEPPRPRVNSLRCGMLPAFTPMRIGTLRAFASRAMSATFALSVMLPGLRRRQCDPGLEREQREWRVVVDVGDHRDRRLAHDLVQRRRGFACVARHPDDVGAGLRSALNLRDRRRGILGLGLGHRLHRDRCSAADDHAPDANGNGGPARFDRRTPLGHSLLTSPMVT